MKTIFFIFLIGFLGLHVYAQKEFHVFPKDHITTPGTKTGDGTISNPWDLQTALNQSSQILNGGDTIWLHNGIYRGRFKSQLKSTISGKNIIVSSYPNEWAILNGNVAGPNIATLSIRGNNVTYRDFEVSPINLTIRDESIKGFVPFGGISHNGGQNCQFINLIIHGNNGLGFGSWNKTGGTLISNCIVYDNGFKGKNYAGIGEGFYVQNDSDTQTRVLKDNIIFNNYYKGIEVWSANKKADREYVKNITLDNNVIFNSGLVSGRTVDNIIVATNDRNAINIAKNIQVTNNILYHNTNYKENEVNGDAPSLTIGFFNKAPVENVVVTDNIILGRNNPLRLLYAKSFNISNNIIYGGYIHVLPFMSDYLKTSTLDNNAYYTKNSTPFIMNKKKYRFEEWKETFQKDNQSTYKSIKEFQMPNVLDISKNDYKENSFRVVLFSKEETDVIVDFSNYNLPKNSEYIIRDVENYNDVLISGKLSETSQINFPMALEREAYKSRNNFGVYIIDFETTDSKDQLEQEGFLKRFFKWLF